QKLEPGMKHAQIALLRARLVELGYFDAAGGQLEFYDDMLAETVKSFQHDHGLAEDGKVGPATRTALNETVPQKIRRIEMNMERLRWLPDDMGDRYVTINLPSYTLRAFEN